MSLKDLANTHVVGQSIKPDSRSADNNGVGVDFRSCGPQVTAILSVGDLAGTSPTIDVTLEESDDNVTFTAISGAAMTQVTAGDQIEAITFFNRSKRYVRAVADHGGTSAIADYSVTLMARKTSY